MLSYHGHGLQLRDYSRAGRFSSRSGEYCSHEEAEVCLHSQPGSESFWLLSRSHGSADSAQCCKPCLCPLSWVKGLLSTLVESYLYAADRLSLRSYAIDPVSGLLSLKNSSTQVEGGAYTISLSPDGHFAYTIENNNDLVSYDVNNGVFIPVGTIYTGVYGLEIAVDPSGSFVYVPQACGNCPSGVYNVIHQYSITKTGRLAPLATPTVAAGMTPFGITVTSQ
jgi:DNA-binding beta-propeller fold protein YncE